MPHSFERPHPSVSPLAPFLDEAGRLRAYVPPFRFTSFFSPEDTLLCAVAAEAALARARTMRRLNGRALDPLRIVELTTGSGLVGLHLLRLENGSRLIGLDVDEAAIETAHHNSRILELSARAHFEHADLWSRKTERVIADYSPHLLVCNPPYIPEPEGTPLEGEAGAGPDGTAHLRRAIEVAEAVQPRAIALSWCSVSDPAAIVSLAEAAGYTLNSLFIVAIADGEYSGTVHDYLRSLPTAYINERRETLDAVAPDGAARFAYLLMAGDFSRDGDGPNGAAEAVGRICESFATEGLSSLLNIEAPVPVRAWILDRWDEVRLRASLHGPADARIPASVMAGRESFF
jgi:methylase of polypeptide subunit release factors